MMGHSTLLAKCLFHFLLVKVYIASGSENEAERCSNTITVTGSGYISSPSHPNNYGNNLNCAWRRYPENGRKTKLTITSYDLEEGFDFLEIYENDILLGRLNGINLQALVFIITGTMELRLRTDGTVVRKGFNAEYKDATCGTSLFFADHNGENYNEKTITSPGWPNNYPNDAECHYTFEVPEGSQIQLNIITLRTEPCCDYLQIDRLDGTMQDIVLRGSRDNVLFISISNRVQMRFFSDGSITEAGFQIRYRQDTLCPPGKWTEFFNRDTPSGNGESEDLGSIQTAYPNKVCSKPSRIDARLLNFLDYSNAGQRLRIGPLIGLSCVNNFPGNRDLCSNYQVRFCCPPEPRCGGEWTRFYNRDSPSGNGDHEGLIAMRSEHPGAICEYPTSIDVRLLNDKDYRRAGMNVRYSHLWGFDCFNADQASGRCPDFKIRFCCPFRTN